MIFIWGGIFIDRQLACGANIALQEHTDKIIGQLLRMRSMFAHQIEQTELQMIHF